MVLGFTSQVVTITGNSCTLQKTIGTIWSGLGLQDPRCFLLMGIPVNRYGDMGNITQTLMPLLLQQLRQWRTAYC